jgi:hypothetical protein
MHIEVPEAVAKAVEELRNTKAGWVTRRDAADLLGAVAKESLRTLQEHREEPDRDVRRTVVDILDGMDRPEPVMIDGGKLYSLEELARACEKEGKRAVSAAGDGFVVQVQLEKRFQKVYLMPYQHRDGSQCIRILTWCGDADEKAMRWALRNNRRMIQCAFALIKKDGEERLALVSVFRIEHATPHQVKAAVKTIAAYGDWYENKTTGEDVL